MVSSSDYQQMLDAVNGKKVEAVKKSKSKYNNVKVEVDGEKFDSKKEAARYGQLLLLERAGNISSLKRQVSFDLKVNSELICKYVADFVYNVGSNEVVEDVKSEMTKKLAVYRIKKKLMKAIHGIEIIER